MLITAPIQAKNHQTCDFDGEESIASWFWNNKAFSIPMLAAAGFTLWDGIQVARGTYKDKTWAETAKGCYKGIIGAAALPALWGLSQYCNTNSTPQNVFSSSFSKEPGYQAVYKPVFDDFGKVVSYDTKYVFVGKRKFAKYAVVRQGYNADCGYHAVYNALCLAKNNFYDLCNSKKFESTTRSWKKAVFKARNCQSFSDVDSREIEEIIIKKHVPALRGKHNGEEKQNVFLKDNISLIDNLDSIQQMITVGAIAGIDKHTIDNIQRFRKRRTPQIIILNNSSGDIYANHSDSWHWLTIKLEQVDEDGHTVKISIFDSIGKQVVSKLSPSTEALMEKVYHLFVNTPLS